MRKKEKAVVQRNCKNNKKKQRWQKPTLEDVSEKIMAQPYIRFT
ncbi:MAG: hypothetical protein ACK4NT_07025 [Candidatus Omnitrophota bacterium]